MKTIFRRHLFQRHAFQRHPPQRHPWRIAGVTLSLLVLCSIGIHPFGAVKTISETESKNIDNLNLPLEIDILFEQSCLDCHSNQTKWPWYSYVAPASWLVERDVRRARNRMNLSRWQQYTPTQQEKLLADIASAVRNGEMPPRQYTLVHPLARLSNVDAEIIYDWARTQRRSLKATSRLSASKTKLILLAKSTN